MTITTLTSRQLRRNTGQAKKAALTGPVVITERGKPAYVLMTIEDYRRLSSKTSVAAESVAAG